MTYAHTGKMNNRATGEQMLAMGVHHSLPLAGPL
jgi:hypothetical protein